MNIIDIAEEILVDDWDHGDETGAIDYESHKINLLVLAELIAIELPDEDEDLIMKTLVNVEDELFDIIAY